MEWVDDGFTDNAPLWQRIVGSYCLGGRRKFELGRTDSDEQSNGSNVANNPVVKKYGSPCRE